MAAKTKKGRAPKSRQWTVLELVDSAGLVRAYWLLGQSTRRVREMQNETGINALLPAGCAYRRRVAKFPFSHARAYGKLPHAVEQRAIVLPDQMPDWWRHIEDRVTQKLLADARRRENAAAVS